MVDVAAEGGALLGDSSRAGEREDLEPAGVGEHRARPAHEAVDAPQAAQDLRAGPQQEVIGVGEQHLRPRIEERLRQLRLHRGLRAHRHEDRSQDLAVEGAEDSGARARPASGRDRSKTSLRHVHLTMVKTEILRSPLGPGGTRNSSRRISTSVVESSNGTLRKDCLDAHWFEDLGHARRVIGSWRQGYNNERPHSGLGDLGRGSGLNAHTLELACLITWSHSRCSDRRPWRAVPVQAFGWPSSSD